MADEVENKTTEEVQGQQSAPEQAEVAEVQETAAVQESEPKRTWKIGDETLDDPDKVAEVAKKWSAEFTRVSQKNSELSDRVGAFDHLVSIIQSDPDLLQKVQAKMAAGQSAQQAVQSVAQQADPRLDQLSEKLERIEMREAQSEFLAKHSDLTDKEKDAIASWLTSKEKSLSGWSYGEMLDAAYHHVVLPLKLAKLSAAGEKAEGEEKPTKKQTLLGSQASSSNAKALSFPKGKLSPKQEREWANKLWREGAKRK